MSPRNFAFIAILLLGPHESLGVEVSPWSEWVAAKASREIPTTIPLRAEKNRRERTLRRAAARQVAVDYFAGRGLPSELDQEKITEILPDLNRAFLDRTMAILRHAPSPAFRFLAAKIRRPAFSYSLALRPPEPSAPTKAGFHRRTQSVYLNLREISPDEWLIIFIHETLHALDEELVRAVSIYNDELLLKSILNELRTYGAPSDSAPAERWLRAGLNRGLLAEHRAWTLSLAYYEEGRRIGILRNVSWLEEIARAKPLTESWNTFSFHLLDRSFYDPTEGAFQNLWLREETARLREEIRKNIPLPTGWMAEALRYLPSAENPAPHHQFNR